MNKLKSKFIKVFSVICTIIFCITVILIPFNIERNGIELSFVIKGNNEDVYQMFYSAEQSWSEENSQIQKYDEVGNNQEIRYQIPKGMNNIRFDIGTKKCIVEIESVMLKYSWKNIDVTDIFFNNDNIHNNITEIEKNQNVYLAHIDDNDPFIIVNLDKLPLEDLYRIDLFKVNAAKMIMCILVLIANCVFIKYYNKIAALASDFYNSKGLILRLAKNDFRTKYAGSYLGIIWAFINPVITVLIYWFVFQVGFKSAPIDNFPFVLWLVSGIVPWFFFSDTLMSASNCMLEYSYLVKKVVFKISILPIVKIVSAFFVHLFFVIFTIFLFNIYGYPPSIYMIQTVYYSICIFALSLGITYATSAIIIFFKDLGQIITIFLQIGMWMTPIMWSYNILSPKYQFILKLNPLFYIVEGYRDAFINHIWFWEKYNQTLYFWVICTVIFISGVALFKKLKPHFADVL